MPYEQLVLNGDFPVIDLRSDTITKPTQEMRNAMRDAEVGDDVYNEDPTVKTLERQAADILGKENALFVPTGTMANLIAIMVHCNQRGSEIIVGHLSHTFLFEQAGCAQIAGVQIATVKNKPDGTFNLQEVKEKIRINPDVHEPITALIVTENTHNMCGGKVLPLNWLRELAELAKKHKILLHMDGARLFNASVRSNIPAKEIVKDFDSVCFCLSKGLGVPLGALLVGTNNFIAQARRMRKALGGGMRQIGIIAAAGLVAMDKMINRLIDDHRRTYQIWKAIADFKSKYFKVESSPVLTNILMIYLDTDKFNARNVLERLMKVEPNDNPKVCVRAISRNVKYVRITLYYEVSDSDVCLAIEKLKLVMAEFDKL